MWNLQEEIILIECGYYKDLNIRKNQEENKFIGY